MKDKNEWLFSWGYHKLWHGKLDRSTLDAISATRPIMVWQRSCHEFFLNTAAVMVLGLTEESMKGKGNASTMMSWAEGHWWETGMNLILEPCSRSLPPHLIVRSGSVVKRHVPLSFHSDLPMAASDPLYLAWCAVNRVTPSGRVAAPEQRVGVLDALRAVTIEAAYSWQKENEIGSIAPGKIANFTVLEEDPLAVAPLKLKDVEIWGTVFEGRPFPIARKPSITADRATPSN